MQVVIMGLGYIGLPTAALMAGKGMHVHGVDINPDVVETINKGQIHIIEPELEGLVHYGVQQKLLKASTVPVQADVYLIAVPTPFKEDHKPDISYVESAAKMVAPFLREGSLFIIESTSPVGTTEKIAELLFSMRPDLNEKIFIAYCPERVLPGNVIHELQYNDRVIGGVDGGSTEKAVSFYEKFIKGNLHKTNARTAEMCKLVENAYRDVNIAFANELSIISDKAGIDVNELINLASKHPRVKILKPGPGVGGHCIAVDPWFLVSDFPDETKMIRQARETNNFKTAWVIEKIIARKDQLRKQLNREPVLACMGLTYKSDIDDVRESPAMGVYKKLLEANCTVIAVEPHVKSTDKLRLTDAAQAMQKADLLIYLVAHKVFKSLPKDKEQETLDFCGVLS